MGKPELQAPADDGIRPELAHHQIQRRQMERAPAGRHAVIGEHNRADFRIPQRENGGHDAGIGIHAANADRLEAPQHLDQGIGRAIAVMFENRRAIDVNLRHDIDLAGGHEFMPVQMAGKQAARIIAVAQVKQLVLRP